MSNVAFSGFNYSNDVEPLELCFYLFYQDGEALWCCTSKGFYEKFREGAHLTEKSIVGISDNKQESMEDFQCNYFLFVGGVTPTTL